MATSAHRVPHAASRRAGAVPAAALALAFSTVTLGGTLPTPLYGLYADRFALTTTAASAVYGAYAVGTLIALLLFGRLSDVLGRRPLALAACAVGAASSVTFLLADGLGVLLAARVLSGLSVALAAGAVTAHLIDLHPAGDRARASRLATLANFGGLAVGPLVAGVLAETTRAGTHVPFVVHLVLLAAGAALVLTVPETVARRRGLLLALQRLGIPERTRRAFVPAAAATAAAFAVFGVFAGLAARFVRVELGSGSLVLAGVAAFAVFGAAAVAQLAVASLGPARALDRGAALLPAALALLVAALVWTRIELFLAAAVVGGTGAGLAFVAALARVAATAPPDRRAEVASSLFVVAYAAMSLPVVGIGVASEALGVVAATCTFAALAAVLAVLVLVTNHYAERTSS